MIAIFLNTVINIDGEKLSFSELLLDTDMTPMEGPFLWFLFVSTMVFYLVIGIFLFLTTLRPNLERLSNAKRVVMLGMDLLVLTFIRLGYMTFLEKTPIDIDGEPIAFKAIIFWQSVTPLSDTWTTLPLPVLMLTVSFIFRFLSGSSEPVFVSVDQTIRSKIKKVKPQKPPFKTALTKKQNKLFQTQRFSKKPSDFHEFSPTLNITV